MSIINITVEQRLLMTLSLAGATPEQRYTDTKGQGFSTHTHSQIACRFTHPDYSQL